MSEDRVSLRGRAFGVRIVPAVATGGAAGTGVVRAISGDGRVARGVLDGFLIGLSLGLLIWAARLPLAGRAHRFRVVALFASPPLLFVLAVVADWDEPSYLAGAALVAALIAVRGGAQTAETQRPAVSGGRQA